MFDSSDQSYDADHACDNEAESVLPPVPDDLLTDMDPAERARLDELDWLE